MLKKLFIGLSVCGFAFFSAINSKNVAKFSQIAEGVESISKTPGYVDEDRNTTTTTTTTTTKKTTTTTTGIDQPDL